MGAWETQRCLELQIRIYYSNTFQLHTVPPIVDFQFNTWMTFGLAEIFLSTHQVFGVIYARNNVCVTTAFVRFGIILFRCTKIADICLLPSAKVLAPQTHKHTHTTTEHHNNYAFIRSATKLTKKKNQKCSPFSLCARIGFAAPLTIFAKHTKNGLIISKQ